MKENGFSLIKQELDDIPPKVFLIQTTLII